MTGFLMLCLCFCVIPVFEFCLVSWLIRVEERNLAKLTCLMSFPQFDALKASKTLEKMKEHCIQSTSPFLVLGCLRHNLEEVILGSKNKEKEPTQVRPSSSCDDQRCDSVLQDEMATGVQASTLTQQVISERLTCRSDDPRIFSVSQQQTDREGSGVTQASTQKSGTVFNDLGLSSHQLMLMCEGWKLLDRNDSGTVSRPQMWRGMQSFGLYYTPLQISELFSNLSLQPDQNMNQGKFLELLANYDKVRPSPTMTKSFLDHPPSNQLEIVTRWLHITTFVLCIFIWSLFFPHLSPRSSTADKCTI